MNSEEKKRRKAFHTAPRHALIQGSHIWFLWVAVTGPVAPALCKKKHKYRNCTQWWEDPTLPPYSPRFNLQIKCPVPIPSQPSASGPPPNWRQWAQAGQPPVDNHLASWYFNHQLGARYIIVGEQLFIMGNWDKLADQLIPAHMYIAVNHREILHTAMCTITRKYLSIIFSYNVSEISLLLQLILEAKCSPFSADRKTNLCTSQLIGI